MRAHHDQRRGAGADEEPLHATVPDHEPEEPRLPGDCRQHGQRGLQHELHGLVRQPEIAKTDVAELLQLLDSVEAKQYKRPDMNGDLRLGFALDDFAGTKWKNLTGTTRWSDGTEMVTLDYSHLTLHLPAHVGLQRLKGHGLRHVKVALPCKSVQLPRVPHVEVVGQVPQRLHLALLFQRSLRWRLWPAHTTSCPKKRPVLASQNAERPTCCPKKRA